MANVRVFLWVTLLATVFVAYSAWVRDYPPIVPTPQYTPTSVAPSETEPLREADVPSVDGASASGQQPLVAETQATPAPSAVVHVRTDVLDVLFDQHGDLVRADLLDYPVSKRTPDQVVRLLDNQRQDRFVFQTGIAGVAGVAAPNHLAAFRAAAADYALAAGEDELVVTFDWVGEGPITARKTYTFRRGEYAIDLALAAATPSGATWRGKPYVRLERRHNPVKRSYFSGVDSYSFTGPLLFDGNSYEKLQIDTDADTGVISLEEPVSKNAVMAGWLAAIQHHFVAAAVPPLTDTVDYKASTRGSEFVLSGEGSVAEVTATAPLDYRVKLFVGPKLQDQLKAAGPKLDQTVDYGKLSLLSEPMFWVLSKIESYVGNWGLAIVLMTALIKLAFYKLTAMSGRSMAKMRKLAPRMKALQERYKEDRQALSQAMLELYKKEKVNPAAGCVPMLIQMPFFFAFYWVLIESVEMRQAPFMLWINDLSSRDPFFVLPLLMGVAMFFQTRMSPAPPDPMQARIMQIMPVLFTGMFLLFPAGLVLYWLTNTVLTMLQQWRINKIVARETAPA